MLAIDIQAQAGTLALQAKLDATAGTTVLIGPNGAGKSTLLKCILGARECTGRITLGGHTLLNSQEGIHVPTEDRRLGYVPQSYALFPHMTVSQNVSFGIRRRRSGTEQGKVMELLDELSVAHLAQRKPGALSGGESQRVALARALAIGPEALLLDEPMAALDATARRSVRTYLAARLRATEIPTLVVTHDIEDVVTFGDRVAVLEEGQIVQVGTLQELQAHPATAFVEQLVGRQS